MPLRKKRKKKGGKKQLCAAKARPQEERKTEGGATRERNDVVEGGKGECRPPPSRFAGKERRPGSAPILTEIKKRGIRRVIVPIEAPRLAPKRKEEKGASPMRAPLSYVRAL